MTEKRPSRDSRDGTSSPAPATEPAPRGDPPTPTRVARYQLLFELARGGMGAVYAARLVGAHGFDRVVAVKRLKAEGSDPEELSAFLEEARVTAQLKHPNIVPTLELFEHEDEPFIVMDLVEGVSLAELLAAGGPPPVELVAWVMRQVAIGLHAAHELTDRHGAPRNLVHRDVSPENVLLSFDGRVYVADFGVAKVAGRQTKTESGVVKGKVAYMSPEQTEARPLDRRSDVFAFGVVLYEALTGFHPFLGNNLADTVRRIISETPPAPSTRRPDLPAALDDLVMRCLERSPRDRPADARVLADALREHVRAGPAVDEQNLSALLARRFPDARANLRARIDAAIGGRPLPDPKPSPAEQAPTPAIEPPVLSGTVAVPMRRGPALWLLGGALMISAGLISAGLISGRLAWWARSPPPRPPSTEASASPSGPTALDARAPSTPSSTQSSRESSEGSSPPKSTAAPAGTSSVETPPRHGPTPPARPTPSTPAPPAAAPSSFKGKPFLDLDGP